MSQSPLATGVGAVNAHTAHFLDVVDHFANDPHNGYRHYHLMVNFQLGGRIDPDKFRRAVLRLIDVNPAFRTSFRRSGTSWAQVVEPRARDAAFEVISLTNIGDDWREAARTEIVKANEIAFDVTTAPLFKVILLKFRDTAVFLTKFHHMICDGWGILVALNQLLALYEAELAGVEAPIPPLPAAAYLEFADADNARFDSAEGEQLISWWKSYLADHPMVRNPLPARPGGRLAVHQDLLPIGPTQRLMRTAESRGFHFSYLVHAAFVKALCKRLGSNDALVTFVRANRNDRNAMVVGNFADWVMVRHRFDLTHPLADLAAQAQADVAAVKEKFLPYWTIVKHIAPGQYFRDFGITPYSFDYLPAFSPKIDVGGQASFHLLRELEVLPFRVTATDIFCRANVVTYAESPDQALGLDLVFHQGVIGQREIAAFTTDIVNDLNAAAAA